MCAAALGAACEIYMPGDGGVSQCAAGPVPWRSRVRVGVGNLASKSRTVCAELPSTDVGERTRLLELGLWKYWARPR